MERLFDSINFFLYFVILLYFIGYITGNADLSGVMVFSTATIVGNIIAGVVDCISNNNNAKKFDNLYIYGNKKGRR